MPYGASWLENRVNFAIYIKEAKSVTLTLFSKEAPDQPFAEILLDPAKHCTGDVWHVAVAPLPLCTLYGYRVARLQEGEEKTSLLLDPYASSVFSHQQWGALNQLSQPYQALGRVVSHGQYDWQGVIPPSIASKDLVIYEMHVRGFTKHSSSQTSSPGTFSAIIEKIPYLKSLGINAIELLPIFEFNECENLLIDPASKQKLVNYFGYSTVNFFSLMNRYLKPSPDADGGLSEFKEMVKALHQNGMALILDVVYNHSFEGNEKGPTLSFKGLDPKAYYMIDENGNYLNFSGCGNTLNCNHPVTLEFILDSLRYWVSEMHVDGFRFDLASILTRAENGAPLPNSPLVEAISKDPILSKTILIAEAWDAGGLYQVGGFYPGTRWSEWNGKYRDSVRRFIKGTSGYKTEFATALSGSQNIYGWRGSPACSVNFITAHDGFSLADLVTYNEKHNLANGENNQDGFDHNDSWNCGVEGHSSNKKIVFLRERQIRNFALALFISQGIPMIYMGDEYAHSRHGNNNTWCQDNELNWFLWDQVETRKGFLRFIQGLIHFRHQEPLLRRDSFLNEEDVSWHGQLPNTPDWEKDNGLVALSLNIANEGPQIYAVFNAFHLTATVKLPSLAPGYHWYWVVNTYNPAPQDYFEESQRKKLEFETLRVPAYSAYLLKAVKEPETIFPQPNPQTEESWQA